MIWVITPAFRQPPGLDLFVHLAGIALLGNRDKSRNDDLVTTCLEILGPEVSLKHLEELLDHSSIAQPLPEEVDCVGIWNPVHYTKPDKLLK